MLAQLYAFLAVGWMGYQVYRGFEENDKVRIASIPIVCRYLEDDLASEPTANLDLLRTANQKDLVKILGNQGGDPFAANPDMRFVNRYRIYSLVIDDVLSGRSRVSETDLKDPKMVEALKNNWQESANFKFLDSVTEKINPDLVLRSSPTQKANMWVEAVLRAQAFYTTAENPARADGVNVCTYVALFGMASDSRFIQLQKHQGQ